MRAYQVSLKKSQVSYLKAEGLCVESVVFSLLAWTGEHLGPRSAAFPTESSLL